MSQAYLSNNDSAFYWSKKSHSHLNRDTVWEIPYRAGRASSIRFAQFHCGKNFPLKFFPKKGFLCSSIFSDKGRHREWDLWKPVNTTCIISSSLVTEQKRADNKLAPNPYHTLIPFIFYGLFLIFTIIWDKVNFHLNMGHRTFVSGPFFSTV